MAVAAGPLPLRTVRNADSREVSLELAGRTVLRFATAYGFRNIQSLMRQMKRGRCEYDYVEVMACPSGAAPSAAPPWQTLVATASDLQQWPSGSIHPFCFIARPFLKEWSTL